MNIKINILLSIMLLYCLSCSESMILEPDTIRIKGSDTMRPLIARWGEEFMKTRPGFSVYTEGGGTESGVKALIDGTADICAASRPLRAGEMRLLAEKYNKIGMKILVAKDAISVYLNPENPVKNLTLDHVQKIFKGKITNWKEVNGFDEPISVIIRPPNSGTHLYFKEHILNDSSYSLHKIILPTTNTVVDYVTKHRQAIGYGGIAYGSNINHSKINGVLPTIKNVQNDKYPIIRYLYLYTIDTPRGKLKTFIDWILKDGQYIVKEVGYIPLWSVEE